MTSTSVHIHETQYPGCIQQELGRGLEQRILAPKFHYLSARQTEAWLKLHQTYSLSRISEETSALYSWAVEWVTSALKERARHGIAQYFGVGCGGGKKDALFLESLVNLGGRWRYYPMDIGVNMVLEAACEVKARLNNLEIVPWVADFLQTPDLIDLAEGEEEVVDYRVLTFLGMVPNLPPEKAFQMIRGGLRTGDWLVVSANLAPGLDYRAGLQRVLEQYDNTLTREWLSLLLLDLGFPLEGGREHPIRFSIEEFPPSSGWLRIVAHWHMCGDIPIRLGNREFKFLKQEALEIFYSYRFTPENFSKHLLQNGLEVVAWRQTENQEEGVFVCRKV